MQHLLVHFIWKNLQCKMLISLYLSKNLLYAKNITVLIYLFIF